MTHFRKRLDAATLNQINEWIAVECAKQVIDHDVDDKTNGRKTQSNREKARKAFLIVSKQRKAGIQKYAKPSANS